MLNQHQKPENPIYEAHAERGVSCLPQDAMQHAADLRTVIEWVEGKRPAEPTPPVAVTGTPRVDSMVLARTMGNITYDIHESVPASFARTLERELAEAERERDEAVTAHKAIVLKTQHIYQPTTGQVTSLAPNQLIP